MRTDPGITGMSRAAGSILRISAMVGPNPLFLRAVIRSHSGVLTTKIKMVVARPPPVLATPESGDPPPPEAPARAWSHPHAERLALISPVRQKTSGVKMSALTRVGFSVPVSGSAATADTQNRGIRPRLGAVHGPGLTLDDAAAMFRTLAAMPPGKVVTADEIGDLSATADEIEAALHELAAAGLLTRVTMNLSRSEWAMRYAPVTTPEQRIVLVAITNAMDAPATPVEPARREPGQTGTLMTATVPLPDRERLATAAMTTPDHVDEILSELQGIGLIELDGQNVTLRGEA